MRNYQVGDQLDFHDGTDDVTATVTGVLAEEEPGQRVFAVFCHQHGTHLVKQEQVIELDERDILALTPDSIRYLRSETHEGIQVAVRMFNGETVRGTLVTWNEKRVTVKTSSGVRNRDVRYVTGVYPIFDVQEMEGGTL